MLRKDLSTLPSPSTDEGLTPDPEPRFGHLLAEKWAAEDNGKPTAGGTRYRFSDAAKCARHLSLKAAGFEPEPFDTPGLHVMQIGTWLHEQWQAAVQERYPDAKVEGTGTVSVTSGHYDLLLEIDCPDSNRGDTGCDRCNDAHTLRVLVELKTTGGFSYKLATGERGAAQGPRESYIVQAALNARAHDADEVVIVLVATEAISKGAAERKGIDEYGRFVAEWTFTRGQIDRYADEEIKRLEAIDALVDDGKLAPRHVPYDMPPGARIVDTDRAMWTLAGEDGEVLDTGQVMGGNLCPFYCNMKAACDKFSDPETPGFGRAD